MPAPIHLKPCTDLAPRVLLPGDPHRALAMAQALLEEPAMFNHQRGLWGYTGAAPDGEALTIQATGMGGPSAAVITEELIALGAVSLIRVGTCGALVEGPALGDPLVVAEVLAADGTSRALGAGERVTPDPGLTSALAGVAGDGVTVVSSDVFYDDRPEEQARWIDAGAVAVEMEAAAVLTVCARHGVAGACLLGVTDLLEGAEGRQRIDAEALDELGVELGRLAMAALAAPVNP